MTLAPIGTPFLNLKLATSFLESVKIKYPDSKIDFLIKKELMFCTNEYFYGKSRPYVQTYVCQHPTYQWPLCFDLKQDPTIYLKMSNSELTAAMKKNPKFMWA